MKKFTNHFRRLVALCLAVSLCVMAVPAQAVEVDSPTNNRPTIMDAIDAFGNDIKDILVITLYHLREEMKQGYKIENFEIAMRALTQKTIEAALKRFLLPGMNPKYLTTAMTFYVHEKDDEQIVQLPASIRISTPLSKGDYMQVLAFAPAGTNGDAISGATPLASRQTVTMPSLLSSRASAEVDHSNYEWIRVPSVLYDDGSIGLYVPHYGSYAVITYRAPEDEYDDSGDDSGSSSNSDFYGDGSGTTHGNKPPRSPQTGDDAEKYAKYDYALFLVATAGYVAYLLIKNRKKNQE